MKDKFIPRNQADCDHANALREYEAAHKHWMNTSVFSPDAAPAKAAKNEARDKYESEYRKANPTHILL